MTARDTDPSSDPVESARLFWVRVNQSFAKTASGNTGWSVTTARNQSIPGSIRSRLGRFGDCADRLVQTTIENRDAVEIIESLATPETLIYADPPYLPTTRVGRNGKPRDYAHEMTHAGHERLAECLNSTQAAVILSGYHSPLYESLYRGWHRIEVPVTAFSSNAKTSVRGGRTEVLWLNYEPSRAEQMTLAGINADYD